MACLPHNLPCLERLQRAGLIPPETRRVVIDIRYDAAVRILYETFAQEPVLDVLIGDVIEVKTRPDAEVAARPQDSRVH